MQWWQSKDPSILYVKIFIISGFKVLILWHMALDIVEWNEILSPFSGFYLVWVYGRRCICILIYEWVSISYLYNLHTIKNSIPLSLKPIFNENIIVLKY